jgi:Putative lumazine-binding
MFREMVLTVLVVSLAGCASAISPARFSPVGHQSDEEAAVLEALNRYMTAISASDLATMAGMQTADGMTYQWRPGEAGKMHITAHPNSYWVDPSQNDGHAYRERYWSPSVMIRGAIAVVWVPYEFWIDGNTSHCGIDVMDFVKIDGRWLVSNAMWTVEPDACAELRPVGTATLRPED